ncbi:MAG: type II toxin-antitoxin system RelE/ParE family toxin [Nitrosospira sp.]|nr:type II toxin-antitoxin system RelE/ParE family toxin [Nitrosospira sp.]
MKSMPHDVSARINRKIEQLAADPFAPNNNVKKLEGRDGFRLRVGGWRVIYSVYNDRLTILIVAAGPRGGVHK